MKVVGSSDWRDAIPFETPMIVAEVVPGDPTRCSICGADSELLPRTELWALKHRHPNDHGGFVRFYCAAHVITIQKPSEPVETQLARTTKRAERRPAVRRSAPVVERARALCPNCFVEVAATGVCGMCGQPAS